jgi:hypothetical protein
MTSISFCLMSYAASYPKTVEGHFSGSCIGGVPLDVELTRQLEGSDVVLRARQQVHGEEPLGERRARLVEDRAGARRGLHAAVRALEEPLGRKVAVAPASALGTDKAVGPAHPDERGVAQILAAVEPAELGHAGPFRT